MADSDIEQGQRVGLKMKDGLLFATNRVDSSATGVAVSSVKHGEDIGISNIEGLVELTRGRVTILQIPSIQNGGSRQVDFKQLRSYIDKSQTVGTIGIEALAALRQADIEPQHLYGVTEAIIEAARCGVSFTVVCTNDALLTLIKRMEEDKLDYELIDLTRRKT
jgi:putative transcriptional regulator